MQKIFHTVLYILVGYLAMYTAVWLHELGHSVVFYFHQCKEHLFELSVPLHFANANPGQVDMACVNRMPSEMQVLAGMGGILINLLIGIPGSTWIRRASFEKRPIVYFFFLFFVLAHLTEAFSYMTLSNIIPLSDIQSLEAYAPWLRIPVFVAGIWVGYKILELFKEAESSLRRAMIWYTTFSMLAMGGLRLFYTLF